MSNTARKQLGLDSKELTHKNKHEHLPSHNLHVDQDVMFQDVTSKQWHPATITSLGSEPRSYKVTTRKGVTYRKTQAHLKPYTPQSKKFEDEHSVVQSSDMQTAKQPECKKSNTVNNQVQSYTRPKRDIKLPVNFIYKVLCDYFDIILDISYLSRLHKWGHLIEGRKPTVNIYMYMDHWHL